jgi:hypothetical protein
MMQKSTVTGMLRYLGLFAVAIALFVVLTSMVFVPLSLFHMAFVMGVFVFCVAFRLQTLGQGSISQLSIVLSVLYLVCASLPCLIFRKWFGLVFLYLGGLCLAFWVMAVLGVLFAKWLQFKLPSVKGRRVRIGLSPLLFIICCLGLYLVEIGTTAFSGMRAAGLTAPALTCNADELVATKVVPELHAPISGDTNLIWCAPFQLAWNEMVDVVGEGLRFGDDEPECVPWLNQQLMDKSHLDSETYFVAAGAYTPDFIRELNSEIKAQFGSGVFKPEALPKPDETEQLAAFGYLSVNLPFEHAFQRDDHPLVFKGVPVEAFTLPFGEGSEIREERAKRQVRVCYPPEEGEFIVELKTRKTDHQLVLAKVAPDATLAETVAKVVGYVDSLPQEYLETNQQLIVPLFNFDITREYNELIGHTLAVENPAYRGWQIGKAGQNIRFQLDERGAVLRSSSYMMCVFCAPEKHCIFDEPFLLMLRYKGSDQPYFAMWVDNAEILVKAASE